MEMAATALVAAALDEGDSDGSGSEDEGKKGGSDYVMQIAKIAPHPY